MAKIILISGYAEHGKTLVANTIKKQLEAKGYKVVKGAFADYLKFIAKTYFGWDGKKDEAGRTLLQYLGTDVVRKINPDFWAMAGFNFARTFGSIFDFIIFDDARFPNEVSVFKDSNLSTATIRVERLNEDGERFQNSLSQEQRQHPSEISLDFTKSDIYLLNGHGIDAVEEAVASIIPVLENFI